MTAEDRLAQLNLTLPPAPKPMALYQPCLQVGQFLYLSGHGPLRPDGSLILGHVGGTLTREEGVAAARQVGLAMLATVRAHLGTLNRVKRLVKALGWVQCPADFTEQPLVMNGFSELMRDVFGPEPGVGVRSAVGTSALPNGMAVEVEAVFEVA